MDEVVKALREFQASFEESERAAESCETASNNIFKAMEGVAGLNPLLNWTTAFMGVGRDVQSFAVKARGILNSTAVQDYRAQGERIKLLQEQINVLKKQEDMYTNMAKEAKAAGDANFAVLEARGQDIRTIWEKVGVEQRQVAADMAQLPKASHDAVEAALKIGPVLDHFHAVVTDSSKSVKDAWRDFEDSFVVKLFTDAAEAAFTLGKHLQQANGSLQMRQKYVEQGLAAQIQTGASLDVIAEAQKALVDLGMEETENFQDQTQVLAKLNVGLGVSVDQAAQLLSVSDRVGVSYTQMANVVAKVARGTSLNAAEATKYATSIARSVQLFSGQKTNAAFGAATEQILRLEAAMKSTIGESGAIVELMEAINKGEVRGELFGLNMGGKFTGDPKEMESFMDSMSVFAGSVKAAGPFAAETAKGFQQALGVSSKLLLGWEDIRKTMENQQKLNKAYAWTLDENTALEKAYTENLSEAGQVYDALKETIMAMVHYALTPAIQVFKWAMSGLLSFVDAMKKMANASPAITLIFKILGGGVLVAGVYLLGLALMALVATLKKAVNDIHAAAKQTQLAAGGMSRTNKVAGGMAAAGLITTGLVNTYGSRDEKTGELTGGAKMAELVGNLLTFSALLLPIINLLGPLLKYLKYLNLVGPLISMVGRSVLLFGTWIVQAIGAMVTFVAGLITMPVLIVAGIIAAIVAVGLLIYNYWDEICQWVQDAVSWVVSKFNGLAEITGTVIDWFTNLPTSITNWVKDKFDWFGFGDDDEPEPETGVATAVPAMPGAGVNALAMPDTMEEHTRAIVAATNRVEATVSSQTEAQNETDRRRIARTAEERRSDSGADRTGRSKDRKA